MNIEAFGVADSIRDWHTDDADRTDLKGFMSTAVQLPAAVPPWFKKKDAFQEMPGQAQHDGLVKSCRIYFVVTRPPAGPL